MYKDIVDKLFTAQRNVAKEQDDEYDEDKDHDFTGYELLEILCDYQPKSKDKRPDCGECQVGEFFDGFADSRLTCFHP